MLSYVKAYAEAHPLTVFLDIDGVLNVYQPDREVQTLLPYAMENICDLLCRMKANVVIISIHRLGGETWDMLLKHFNRERINVGVTPHDDKFGSRVEEINAYLRMHQNIERFVILDDCFQCDYLSDPNLQKRLVFVDALKGLQKRDVVKACEVLNWQKVVDLL